MQPTITLKEFIQAILLMSVLWKEIKFCNHRAIEMATGCVEAAVKASHKALKIAKINYILDVCYAD